MLAIFWCKGNGGGSGEKGWNMKVKCREDEHKRANTAWEADTRTDDNKKGGKWRRKIRTTGGKRGKTHFLLVYK